MSDSNWRADLTDSERRRVAEIADLDAVPPTEAGALFYAHGYNELRLAVEDLLAMVGLDPGGPAARR